MAGMDIYVDYARCAGSHQLCPTNFGLLHHADRDELQCISLCLRVGWQQSGILRVQSAPKQEASDPDPPTGAALC